MKSVVYHVAAEEELLAAVCHCERERAGRGIRLEALVTRAEKQIRRFPSCGSNFERGTRRLVLLRLPYSLIYLVQADRCLIVAVAHAKREPGYWRERMR